MKRAYKLPELRSSRANYGASSSTFNLVSVDTGGLVADAYSADAAAAIVARCNAHRVFIAAMEHIAKEAGPADADSPGTLATIGRIARAALAEVTP